MEDEDRKEKNQLKSEGEILCSSSNHKQHNVSPNLHYRSKYSMCAYRLWKQSNPPCWCHYCAETCRCLFRKLMFVCSAENWIPHVFREHRRTNYTAVSWLNWMCRRCVHYHVCYSAASAVAAKCEISLRFMVNQFSLKKLRHPQPALCGNICVKSDIWYGKKQKGEGDRVYCRAGQTPWVLVEAAKGCLCLHILHKRLQKCQPMRAWALKTEEA